MAETAEAFELRGCEPGDMAAVTAIYAHAVRHGTASFELEPPDEREMAARRAAMLAAGHPYLVAVLGGEVAGYAYTAPYRARPAYEATVEDSVYVGEAFQGRGAGRLLLRRLVEEAEKAGFRQMIAVIGDSANHGSVRLHAGLGFVHAGTLRSVGWKHGKWLDTVLMQRALGPGDTAPK